MTYVFSLLPTPQELIKQLNIIIYNFLWNRPDKIARLAVVNDIKFGGLRLTDIETSIISLRLAWLGRIYSPGPANFMEGLFGLPVGKLWWDFLC